MSRSIPRARRRGRHAWKVLILVSLSACKQCCMCDGDGNLWCPDGVDPLESRLPDPDVSRNATCPIEEATPFTPSGYVGALADLDGDGVVERIGLANGAGLDVGRNLGSDAAVFATLPTPPNTLMFDVAAAHLGDPDRADLLVTTAEPLAPGGEAYELRVYAQDGSGAFALRDEAYAGLSNGTVLVDRFSAATPDGLDDVAVIAPAAGQHTMRVYANDGAGGLTPGSGPRLDHHYGAVSGRIAPGEPALADVVVEMARPSGLLPVWNQRGESGAALAAATLSPRMFFTDFLLEDLDVDGFDDLVVLDGMGLALGRNVCGETPASCGGFAPLDAMFAQRTVSMPEVAAIGVGDLDADGLVDVVTVTRASDHLRLDVLLQADGFTFARAFIELDRTFIPHALRVGDVDGDGFDDLVLEGMGASSGEAQGALVGAVYRNRGDDAVWDTETSGKVRSCVDRVARPGR